MIWVAAFLMKVSVCLCETASPASETPSSGTDGVGTVPNSGTPTPTNTNKNWHLDLGRNYSTLTNNYGSCKDTDLRLNYSGLKRITPFGSIGMQSRDVGTQLSYGIGSYINESTKFYLIAGFGFAPIRDSKVVLFPKHRIDLTGVFGFPRLKALLLTAGFSDLTSQGGGDKLISLGKIYYHGTAIFSGSLNYNIVSPGNITSLSGQVGIIYGVQGHYYFGEAAAWAARPTRSLQLFTSKSGMIIAVFAFSTSTGQVRIGDSWVATTTVN
jgi:YaiO family outer membrane protein